MKTKRSGLQVMIELIVFVKPLVGMMFLAVLMGCIGNLMAIFLPILGGYGLLFMLKEYQGMSMRMMITLMLIFAVLRGVFRYLEQGANHSIAFRLLARIRNEVFQALRKLGPAKLDGKNKGDIIAVLTSDIELLEVFYAHTISPILIAVVTSVCMSLFLFGLHPSLGMISGLFYLMVGVFIPIMNSKSGNKVGYKYRSAFGAFHAKVLDNLYGMEEILQYQQGKNRLNQMEEESQELEALNKKRKNNESISQIVTDLSVLSSGVVMGVLAGMYGARGELAGYEAVIAVIAMMSSFGPVIALSSLSNDLNLTLASGNRVLDLLKEEPLTQEVIGGKKAGQGDIICENLTFAYQGKENQPVLKNFHTRFQKNKIYAVTGKSGCGKSTLLKLLMRFYEGESGIILYGKNNLHEITTTSLLNHVSYVTQDTFLFQDTIENNIKIAKKDATIEEVIAAAKKASIHEFIVGLPKGYQTMLSELGESLSGGERQRIGVARAFLQESAVILLDEPTSNVDSLNEGMILKSIKEEGEGKTILLVSHGKSALGIADEVLMV